MNNLAPTRASNLMNRALSRKLFVAAPMSGFDSEAEYETHRLQTLEFVELVEKLGIAAETYYAGSTVSAATGYSGSNSAFDVDVGNLIESDAMVFLYPKKVVSSALVEVGIAIGCCIPLLIIVNDRQDLPYMIRDLPSYEDRENKAPDVIIIETSDPRNELSVIETFLTSIDCGC